MRLAKNTFSYHFSIDNLKNIYDLNISLSSATGIDNLSHSKFRDDIDEQVNIIQRKVSFGEYKFTKYKLKLISKGRGKTPREISIPTIRDRITLKALCNFLSEKFDEKIEFKLPQLVIRDIKKSLSSNEYDSFIKLDVANFYPTIKHDFLITRLRQKIRKENIISLIKLAVKTPTVAKSIKSDSLQDMGVPQGLSISNILAAIYLINIDNKFSKESNIKYYRYVDDILILTSSETARKITTLVINEFRKLGLEIYNPDDSEKSKIGKIGDQFTYLGYCFEDNKISVRKSSITKLKESLVSIFTSYKYAKNKDQKFLRWKINLRITGCVFQGKCKGWLFFFAEIDDESLLHKLDNYVCHLMKRFDVNIKPKKFVKSYYQVKYCKYETRYIPNFDQYEIDRMRQTIDLYPNHQSNSLSDEEVKHKFKKLMNKEVKDLQTDIQNFPSG